MMKLSYIFSKIILVSIVTTTLSEAINQGNQLLVGIYKLPAIDLVCQAPQVVTATTGVLVTPRWILTANTLLHSARFQVGQYYAFLLQPPPKPTVVQRTQQRLITSWFVHPTFNQTGHLEDNVALVHLELAFQLPAFRLHSPAVPFEGRWLMLFLSSTVINTTEEVHLVNVGVLILGRRKCLQQLRRLNPADALGEFEFCAAPTEGRWTRNGTKEQQETRYFSGLLYRDATPFALFNRAVGREHFMDNATTLVFTNLERQWSFVQALVPSLLKASAIISESIGIDANHLAIFAVTIIVFWL